MGLMAVANYRLRTLFLCVTLVAVVAFVFRNGVTTTSVDYVLFDDSGSATVSTERFDIVFHGFYISSTETRGAFQIGGLAGRRGVWRLGTCVSAMIMKTVYSRCNSQTVTCLSWNGGRRCTWFVRTNRSTTAASMLSTSLVMVG